MSELEGGILILAIFLAGVALYFLPWLVALGRSNRNTVGIFILNLLTGWTLLGWVASFIWAFVGENKRGDVKNITSTRP